jgi:hypothetical protein
MSKEEYLSGAAFVNATPAQTTLPTYNTFSAPSISSEHEEGSVTSTYFQTSRILPRSNQGLIRSIYQPQRDGISTKNGGSAPDYFPIPNAPPQSQATTWTSRDMHVSSASQSKEDLTLEHYLAPVVPPTPFVPPRSLHTGALHTALTIPKKSGPRHDPNSPDAVVLTRPKTNTGTKVVDVVVDPFIARHLRPHQKEGVQFLYECIMGIKEFEGSGAILADEMGLGKTLTVIALIWTLLSFPPLLWDY